MFVGNFSLSIITKIEKVAIEASAGSKNVLFIYFLCYHICIYVSQNIVAGVIIVKCMVEH